MHGSHPVKFVLHGHKLKIKSNKQACGSKLMPHACQHAQLVTYSTIAMWHQHGQVCEEGRCAASQHNTRLHTGHEQNALHLCINNAGITVPESVMQQSNDLSSAPSNPM